MRSSNAFKFRCRWLGDCSEKLSFCTFAKPHRTMAPPFAASEQSATLRAQIRGRKEKSVKSCSNP